MFLDMNRTGKGWENMNKQPVNDKVKHMPTYATIYGIWHLWAKRYMFIGYSNNTRQSCQDWMSRIKREPVRYNRFVRHDYEFRVLDPTIKLLPVTQRRLLALEYINYHHTKDPT